MFRETRLNRKWEEWEVAEEGDTCVEEKEGQGEEGEREEGEGI